MKEGILVVNAGSSSIKFSLYVTDGTGTPVLANKGIVDGIYVAPRFIAKKPDGAVLETKEWADPNTSREGLMQYVLDWLQANMGDAVLKAAGHRVVHGGTEYAAPVIVSNKVLEELDALTPLAPLHQMHNLDPMRILARLYPDLIQVACFDTAFHRTNPPLAQLYALPRKMTEAGIRRYGYHGISYEYIVHAFESIAPEMTGKRLMIAHLGSGASMCAVRDGKSVSNSFGFSTVSGLMMGTRPGTVEAGAVLHMIQRMGMTPEQIEKMLYKECGLQGVSEISSDTRYLIDNPDPRAVEALDLFAWRANVEMGSLMASMGGIDALIFTAGIGENSPPVRAKICAAAAEWTGIRIDDAANNENRLRIDAPGSRIPVWIIPTDEELMIATHTHKLMALA